MGDLAVGTSFDPPYDTNILVDGTGGLCIGCCHPSIAASSYEWSIHNKAGIDLSGNKLYVISHPAVTHYRVFKTASQIYYATEENGIERFTIGHVYIDSLLSPIPCYDVVVDSEGSMYIAHPRVDYVSVTKLNAAGVKQWGFDTGSGTIAACIALSHDETRIFVGMGGAGSKSFKSLLASNGSEEWSVSYSFISEHCTFDVFGNAYVITGSVGGPVVKKYTPAGLLDWTTGASSPLGVATDNNYVFIIGDAIVNGLKIVTVASDPVFPNLPLQIALTNVAGLSICVNSDGDAFIGQGGRISKIDVSDGTVIWTTVQLFPFNLLKTIESVHAGAGTGAPPWVCAHNYVIGDLVTHNSTIYESKLIHLSCDDPARPDEPGIGIDWETYWTEAA